jgi:hypothetical protein
MNNAPMPPMTQSPPDVHYRQCGSWIFKAAVSKYGGCQMMRTILFFLCLALPIQARLGETLEECIKRYGEPTGRAEEDTIVSFNKGEFAITILFVAGKAEWIVLMKPGSVFAEKLTETEIKTLLEANGSGLKWTEAKVSSIAFARVWATPKRERGAYYETLEHKLNIMTGVGRTRLYHLNKKKEQDALKDF